MTIPSEKLVINFPEPEHMKLGEVNLFQPGGFDLLRFTQFLAKYSNWPMAVIEEVEIGEMETVFADLQEKIRDGAVPKASSARSKPGRAGRGRRRPNGRSSSSTPASSA